MAGAPDLFVVCKNCQSEVSPYITECPYCGQRLRKRAPKLDREGRPREPIEPPPPEPEVKQRKPPRLRRAERSRPAERPAREPAPAGPRRPLATILLVVVALLVTLGTQATLWSPDSLIVTGDVDGAWWQLLTTSFVYASAAYQAVALTSVGVFGWLLERRHGAWATLIVYVLGTLVGSALVVLLDAGAISVGANAGALALLCAWAVRDALGRRRGAEDDADMLGVVVWIAVLLLLPVVTVEAHVLAGVGGAVTGALLGVPLARMGER
jgi:membrane associated rhomboid family serine protease